MAHGGTDLQESSSGWRFVIPVAVLAMLGTLISVGLFTRQRHEIFEQARLEVEAAVAKATQDAARSVGSLRGTMAAYPAMYKVAAPVSADEFSQFSSTVFDYRDDLTFVVFAKNTDDGVVVEYTVGEVPASAQGFDLLSDPVSQDAVRLAREEAQTVVVGRRSSPLAAAPAVYAYTPIFDGARFVGVVSAGLNAQTLMEGALGSVDDSRYAISVMDQTTSPPEMLWASGAVADGETAVGVPITMSDLQTLTVNGALTSAALSEVHTWRPWIYLIAGLLLTVAMCALVWKWLDARQIRRTADELQQATNRLRFLAERDALTGLAHRDGLRSWLEDWSLRNPDRDLLVLYVDLDGFKEINSTWGHFSGDLVLRQMGHRLSSMADNRNSIVARVSGDQFVLMRPLDGGIEPTVQRVQKAIAEPIPVSDRDLQLTCSIGVAISPQDGTTLDTLLNHADIAARAAKELPGNSVVRFDPVLAASGAREQQMGRELRAALRDPDSHFWLEYQPQVDMRTGQLIAAEALVRWQRDGQVVAPGDFLGLASDYGLMPDLGRWVLREACRVVDRWRAEVPATVAVNVDAGQLEDGFADVVAAVLHQSRVRADALVVEVTEAAVMGNRAQRELERIRALGVSISIDDFGTGFSSLSRLADLPTQQLKIDRAFVTGLGHSPESLEIVRTIVALARALRLQTLAEGVETAQQAQILLHEGVSIGQGFLFGAPVSAAECLRLWHEGVRMPQLHI